ncbi:MAG: D-ornithine 4,5-aminomutase subunit OraS [bacterium]
MEVYDKEIAYKSHQVAQKIVNNVFDFIKKHSTKSIERTTLRIMGINGANEEGIPYCNILVDKAQQAGLLNNGISNLIAYLYDQSNNDLTKTIQLIEKITPNDIKEIKPKLSNYKKQAYELAEKGLNTINQQTHKRQELIEKYNLPSKPWIYVIVATGNIFEDKIQAISAVRQGADCIAVIRSSAQSLIDYVPEGLTTEGYGGTFATQANFRLMREALDQEIPNQKRYLMLVNYSSGLCMPEIAALAALERLDMLLNDSMYGILFRDINPQRTFIDQYFSRLIITYADIIINTGEDNYLTTADAFEKGYTIITSHYINYEFAKKCNMPDRLIGLGHAYEIRPEIQNSFLYEFAQALLIRQLFPNCPIKYMPPTRWVTGNIFHTHVIDNMFNMVSILTNQHIHLIGVLTEAIHTPLLQDRYLSLKAVKYVFNAAKDLYKEIQISPNGLIEQRARYLQQKAFELLQEVEKRGLFNAIEEGLFADTKRPKDKGKGLEGVFEKSPNYFNPLEEKLLELTGG